MCDVDGAKNSNLLLQEPVNACRTTQGQPCGSGRDQVDWPGMSQEKEAEVSPVGLVVIKLIGLECHRRKRPKSALWVWS
ncbi:hypothetical protein RRG08_000350 [Elysia crispata]|uniref:Uncharacterized protein n=1 Tax=Elysia crispata TaxID=231223 RepID=A0AAE0ZUS5_9GAST|nr:hypothetical protein RRG08_000350 [Elysia crispata]